MGFRFRRSINLGGGFKINLSKSGIGYGWGTKGYRISRTAHGTTRRTYSIPGTGISYVSESGSRNEMGIMASQETRIESHSHRNARSLIQLIIKLKSEQSRALIYLSSRQQKKEQFRMRWKEPFG